MLVCAMIAHFAAQVEQQHNLTRAPLILTTGNARPAVAAFDAQAEAAGVKRGMPIKRAWALCPEAEIRMLVEARLRPTFEALLNVASEFAARYEVQPSKAGSDPVLWLDVGTVANASALALHFRATLRAKIELAAGIGAALGKFAAFAAAMRGDVTVLPVGQERVFLVPQLVNLLPLQPDEARRLSLYGLQRLGQLASLPRAAVTAQFGTRGRLLHQLACGEDPRPLNLYQPPPIERITRRWQDALADEVQFERALEEMAAEASARLRVKGETCQHIALCLTDERGSAREAVRSLREPLAEGQALGRVLRRLCAALPRTEVVSIECELSGLTADQPRQMHLFDTPEKKARSAYELARLLVQRHPSNAFVTPVWSDEAKWMPERVLFAPLEEQ